MPDTPRPLDEIRTRISQLDQELLTLLAERRRLSLDVAKNKVAVQKPIRDQAREQALLEKLVTKAQDHQLDAHYVLSLFHTIIEDSVLIQQRYLQNLANPDNQRPVARVSFLGNQGSYSYLAARQYFSRKQTELVEMACDSFKKVVETVETGHADYGILPVENTSSGSINEVYDQLQHTRLSIVGELTLPIDHCLLTVGDQDPSQIDTLYAHPQPHQQCSEYIDTLGKVKKIYCSSTAEAMQQVADLNQPNVAAIGHAASGEFYGLTAIKSEIANQQQNHTRFIVVARKPVKVSSLTPAKTTFIMSTSQQAGSLVECLMVLRERGINMTKLESRPVLGNPWEEMFYVDVEANMASNLMQSALDELTTLTRYLKVLGCYPSETISPTEVSLPDGHD
jgi:chorismate mutase/prephenate dehydratase